MGRRRAERTDKLVVWVGCPEHEEGLKREEEVWSEGAGRFRPSVTPLSELVPLHLRIGFSRLYCHLAKYRRLNNGVCHPCRSL